MTFGNISFIIALCIIRKKESIMNSLLIATHQYLSQYELAFPFEGRFRIQYAGDGITATSLLRKFQFDALIIDLNLPYRDGLSILMDIFPRLPKAIVVISDYLGEAEVATLKSMGIQSIIQLPCSQFDIAQHILFQDAAASGNNSPTSLHLLKLGINTSADGYRYLQVAIPLCAKAKVARFHKEIYPEIVRQCNVNSEKCVEHAIRSAIRKAWERRDPAVWAFYFPGSDAPDAKCPTCTEFITTLASITYFPEEENDPSQT